MQRAAKPPLRAPVRLRDLMTPTQASTEPTTTAATIGVFDSGVGGLSVLAALHQVLPAHPLHYVADSGHAPYGDRDGDHVLDRSLRVTEHLVRHGARLVVVACNTATALAIQALRAQYPDLPLVGVEPGVKPAVALSRVGRIGVLATPATLSSPRFDDLVARHAGACEVVRVPCAGLAAAIERGEAGRDEIEHLLDRYCAPLIDAGVDQVVLGCTHYPFVADGIARRLGPAVALLDTAQAVARQALKLQQAHALDPLAGQPWPDSHPAAVRLQSTGDPAPLARLAQHGLGLQVPVEALRV